MLNLQFEHYTAPLKILCLGAHCDDIEIGCGGTLLTLAERFPDAEFQWIVFGSNPTRETEARNSANEYLQKIRSKQILIKDFRESYFPYIGDEIKDYFESIKGSFSPDIIFTHYRNDRHQDHRIISDLAWNTFRNHLILEYEIPKYDGDLGSPNFFVPLTKSICDNKVMLLHTHFKSQQTRSWFNEETFRSILRIRGIECNAPDGYAEAHYCRKLTI